MSGNFNDQSVQGKIYADPIDIQSLCLHSDYWDANGVNIRVPDRVLHLVHGAGTVSGYHTDVKAHVFVKFDSGKSYQVEPETLSHI